MDRQLRLFESTEHLERCYDDPDPYATESIYYTYYDLLYREMGTISLKEVIELHETQD